MPPAVLALIALLACQDPGAPSDDPSQGSDSPGACPHDTSAWYLSTGNTLSRAEDGVVDFDPAGDALIAREGTWKDGALDVEDRYADGFYLDRRQLSATVELTPSGWSAEGHWFTVDVLGERRGQTFTETRSGCVLEAEGLDTTEEGYETRYLTETTVSPGRVLLAIDTVYSGRPYVRDEVLTDTPERTWTLDWGEGVYTAGGTYFADGTSAYAYVQQSNNMRYEGTYAVAFDGSQQLDFVGLEYETDSVLVRGSFASAYDGTGEGTYSFVDDDGGTVTCAWVVDAEGCTLDCDNGEMRDCG